MGGQLNVYHSHSDLSSSKTSISRMSAAAVRATTAPKMPSSPVSSKRQLRFEAVSAFFIRSLRNILRVVVVAYWVLKLFVLYAIRRLIVADLSIPPAPLKKWTVDDMLAARQRMTGASCLDASSTAAAGTRSAPATCAPSQPSTGSVDSAPNLPAAPDFSAMRRASARDEKLARLLLRVRPAVPKGSLVEVSAGTPDVMRILKVAELPVRRDLVDASWKHIVVTPPTAGLPSSTLASLDAVCREFNFDGIADAVHILRGGPLSNTCPPRVHPAT